MHIKPARYKAKNKSAQPGQHEEAFQIDKCYAFPRGVMMTVTPRIIIQDE